MAMYLDREDKKKMIIENYGEEKWRSMLAHLDDPDKILMDLLTRPSEFPEPGSGATPC
jgi:hypothetical protein